MYLKELCSPILASFLFVSLNLSCGSNNFPKPSAVDMEIDTNQEIVPNCIDSPTGKGGPMCKVPAGAFWRGCNESIDTQCDQHEKPYQKIFLDTFYIDTHEVTVNEYKSCVQDGACQNKNLTSPLWYSGPEPERSEFCNWGKKGKEKHPINCVSWSDARDYCTWSGKRLPTEAEWEKAARGIDGRIYPWGNQGFDEVTMVANVPDITASQYYGADIFDVEKETGIEHYTKNYNDGYTQTSPVETFHNGKSPYGVFDLSGNVEEWVTDWYSDTWYRQSSLVNPINAKMGIERYKVNKGGSWDFITYLLRTSHRGVNPPECRDPARGFRCAYSPIDTN